MDQIKVTFRRRRKTTILGPFSGAWGLPKWRWDRKVIAPQPPAYQRINGPRRASMKHGWSQILNNDGEVWFQGERGAQIVVVFVKFLCACVYVHMYLYIYIYFYIYTHMYHRITIISWYIIISLIVVAMSIFNIRVVPEFRISNGQPASNKTRADAVKPEILEALNEGRKNVSWTFQLIMIFLYFNQGLSRTSSFQNDFRMIFWRNFLPRYVPSARQIRVHFAGNPGALNQRGHF